MASDTYFLDPSSGSNSDPNFANAFGSLDTFNFSHNSSSNAVESVANILLKGGLAEAVARASTDFASDPDFFSIFAESGLTNQGGSTDGVAESKAKVVANFDIAANEPFSFEFNAELLLEAKEIENPDAEYSKTRGTNSFLILDTTDPDRAEILDYGFMVGRLIPSEKVGKVRLGSFRKGNLKDVITSKDLDVDGNNGTDFVTGSAFGTYQRTFGSDTNITVVEVSASVVKLLDDRLIGNLGSGVQYGSIRKDVLLGTNQDDTIYASLGNDRLFGLDGNDILEAGLGNDRVDGGPGNDRLYGSYGKDRLIGGFGDDELVGGNDDDIIKGGRGSDTMSGGDGKDRFVVRKKSLRQGEVDIIQDFEVGQDKIEIRGWGTPNSNDWLAQVTNQGQFVDTPDGAVFTANSGGQLRFEGVALNALSGSDFVFK